jgi:hypothetical protein
MSSLCHNSFLVINISHHTHYSQFLTQYCAQFQVSLTSVITRGRWLLFFSTPSIETFFSNIKIPYDCEFLVTQPLTMKDSRETSLSLTEIYQDHPTRSLRKQLVANWTSSRGFIWSAAPLLQRRADLHGTSIRVGLSNEVNTRRIINLQLQTLINY